ncbi:MAG: GNAT family N-acetyltransferase [Flavobacterium sp.]|uniref:GNAT family N-acetyltransferase n=1 Tax=Flavobacterium sp. TaxID=239 RepID=UPI0025B82D6C|nr:GNAT family N-acetyltransferase [Flavobacterium sp.]MBA4134883.1 GNAT family N-acetyltransferase [Flavobacterium sp.]
MLNEVQLKIDGKKGFFYIEIEGKQEAMMTFVFAGEDKIIIDHTEVNPGNEGKGLGKKMVAKAVAHARENNIKIIPLCPFAKSVFDKVAEFRDVL